MMLSKSLETLTTVHEEDEAPSYAPPPIPIHNHNNSSDDETDYNVMPFEFSDDEEGAGSYSFGPESDGSHNFQLAELQDQLMGVLMENEQLAAELTHVKTDQVEALKTQLKAEKERIRQLDLQLRVIPPSAPVRRRKLARKREDILYKSKSMIDLAVEGRDSLITPIEGGRETMDDLEIVEDALLTPQFVQDNYRGKIPYSPVSQRVQLWLTRKYEELKEDFSEVNLVVEIPKDSEGDPFNPFKLKKNLIRFGNVSDPITDFVRDCGAITRWENPAVSLAVFIIYMVIMYKGWFITVIILIIISMFSFTYLRHRGWTFGNEVESTTYVHPAEIEKNLGIREQISVLMLVGRRSMNDTGKGADALEKIRNLLLWREPEVTKQAVTVLCGVFVVSLIIPPFILIRLAGLGIGIHLFVIQYIFFRFPRVKQKFDKFEQFLHSLKTDSDFEKEEKLVKKELKKSPKKAYSNSNINSSSRTLELPSSSNSSTTQDEPDAPSNRGFNEIFSLPTSEFPVSQWQDGRRCTLVNKDRSFASGFKIGRMYLTNNYLCFERSRNTNVKNLIIPLETVKSVTKAKLYHWLPGGGKAIEIKQKNSGKAYLFVFQTHMFGTIVNRDEAYESILFVGRNNDFAWARPNNPES